MAKKDNFNKAKVSKVKMPSTGAWLTKAGKSVGLAAFDVLKEMMPATADTISSASEAVSDLRDEMSNIRSQGASSDNIITQTLYSGKESLTKATKSILADLKEGNLYKSPGSDIDDFDMSDFDIGDDSDYDTSFESEDGSTKVTTSKAKPDGGNDITNVNVKVDIGEESPMVDAVRNQTRVATDSAKAQLEYTKLNDTNMMKSFSSLKTLLRGNLGSIDSNLGSIATGITTIAQASSVSLKYYDDSMTMMANINQNLTAIKEYMTQPKSMSGYMYGEDQNALDMFTANGGLDIGAYLKTVKNQASMAVDNNVILSTIKSLFDSRDMLSSMSPLSMATEAIMKKMVPGLVKQAAESFDRTLSESAISFLYRLKGMGSNSDNPLIQFLGETFGIDNKYKDRVDKSNYNRGKVDWNGQSHKTLNEVIPYYLRQIAGSLSGKDEKVYDYERGIFRDLQEVVTEYKERDKAITLDGFTGVLDDFRDYMDNINVQFSDTNMEEAVNKSMERFLTTLVKNNSGGMMQLKDTGDGTMSFLDSISRVLGTSTDDDAAKLIASFFDSNDRAYTSSAFGRKILEARANATKTRNAIEANQTASNAMYVDNGADNAQKKLNYKKSPFVETDAYGKTPIFYMKNIYRLLAEGIRVFPETGMFGGGKTPKYYDKVLANFSELDTEKKSNKARQAAKSARAMTRQDEERVKEEGGFVVGNGNGVSLKALTAAGKDYQKQVKEDELESSRSSLFNKITGLGSDTVLSKIVNTTVNAVNKPSKLLAGVFDYLDNQLFNIVFGGKTGPRGSIINSAMGFMKDKFAQFSTWLNDRILTPVYESLFGDEGLINQIKESQIGQDIKEGFNKFKEHIFGKEDENGNLVGGMFSEFGNDVKNIGKNLYDKVLGDNPDSFWSGAKRQMGQMFNGITNALGYDLEAARKRREKTGKGPVTQMLDDLSVTVKGRFRAWTDALLGPEADPNAMTTQLARGLQADMKGVDTNKIGSSAMFGMITSLFLPGGPILHMLLGAGKSFVKQSETMQTLLFGEKDENGDRKGRFISKELIDLYNENKTGIKVGLGAGVLSAIGILPGLAGGSLTYAVAGGAASFVYNMDSVQEMLFGPKDENGERVGGGFVDRFKKAIGGTKHVKTTGIDAGVGAGIGIVGSLFLPGGPLLWGLSGSILGIAASTDKFKDYMFGAIDKETGKRKGGMLPKLYDQMMGPVKNAIYATQIKAVSFLEERVITPMATAISPMLAQVNYLIEDVRKGVANTVKFVQGKLMDFVLKPAGKATRTIFAPFIKATKTIFKGFLKIVGRVLTSPFNIMKNVGYGLNALQRRRGSKDFKKNTIKNALTFNKEKREKLGLTKEQGKLGNRVKSFAKYYSRKARKEAKFGEKGAWYNKDGMTSRQEQKQRVKESRAWRDYRLKEYKKDNEKRFTKEDRLAFDKKYGYMQWWKSDTAKPKVKTVPVDPKKKLAEIQSDKSTVNTKNVVLNYTGTLKKGTGVDVSDIKGKMATGGTVPSTGVYVLSKGEKVIPNDNVPESMKREKTLMDLLKDRKRKKDQLKYLNLKSGSKEELAETLQSNISDEVQDDYISRRKKMDKLAKKSENGWFNITRNLADRKLKKMQLEDKQNRVLGMQQEHRTKMAAYKAVVEIRDILKSFKKRNDIDADDIKGKKATGGIISQTGAYILSKGEKVIPVAKRGLHKAKAVEEAAYQSIKSGATTAYNTVSSAGQTVVSTLHAKAQQALATGNKYFLDAKGRVLDATEVVKGNIAGAYSKAKAVGGKALEQAKAYGNQALSAGKDALTSLQAKAQSALQQGQTFITDAKGHVMDAAEVVKGNLTSAYSKAKSVGADVLAKAKDIGGQAVSTGKDALSSLQAQAQTALQKGQTFITDAKGRVLNATEVVKGNLSNAYAAAKSAGEKAISQAKAYGNQALSAGKDALASLQAKAQVALQKGQTVIIDAKGHVMDAAEVVKGNLTSAYSKAKQLGSQALNTAKQYGSQAWNNAKNVGTQAWNTGKQYAGQVVDKASQLASHAKTVGTNALNTAKQYGTNALNTAKQYGSQAWNTAQQYGTQALSRAKDIGSSALNTAQTYGSQALGAVQKYGSQALGAAQKYGGQALSAAKGIGTQALSAGQAGLSSLASSASALPGMLSTALSGVSLPTVGLAAGGLLAAGAVGLGAKKLYDRHKRKKALQASEIKGRMAEGGTVKRDGAYILSAGERVVPVQPNGVAKVVIDLKDSAAAARAGRGADLENSKNPLVKVTAQQAEFMKQQVDQMGQMLDLQRIIRSDIDAEKAYKVEQRQAKKAKKNKGKTSAKAKLKEAEQLRKAQEKGRYQTLKKLQDEQKQKEKLYKAIFDIKDNTYEMIDKQEKNHIDWKEIFGKKKGLLALSLLAVVPAIFNVLRNYKEIFGKLGGYLSSLKDRTARSVEMAGGIKGVVSRIGDTFHRMVEWFKDPEARKQTFEDFMDNAKNNKEQLKTYARETYKKARYGAYETMEGIKQKTLGGSDTDAYGSKVGYKAKKVGKRAIQRLVSYAGSKMQNSKKEFLKGTEAFSGEEIKQGFSKVKDGIRSGAGKAKGFVDDVTGKTTANAQDLINREANKIRTVDVRGKVGSYEYYLNDWKVNGKKYLANGDTKLTKEQFQKLYDSKVATSVSSSSDDLAKRAYKKYAKQAGANALSFEEFMTKNGNKFNPIDDMLDSSYKKYLKQVGSESALSFDEFVTKHAETFAKQLRSGATGNLDDVVKELANETSKTKAGKFANRAKDATVKAGEKLNLKQRLTNTVDTIKNTKPQDIVDGVKNKVATVKDTIRGPKVPGADDVMLNARDSVVKKNKPKVGVKQRLTGAKNNIKNAAGKVGSSMKGFADDVAESGIKQATKNSASNVVGKVRGAGTKVAGKVKNLVGEEAAQKATGYIDDMFKWLGNAIKKLAGKFGASSADNIVSKIVTKFSKLLKGGKVFAEFSKRLGKTLVKGAAKLATGLNVIMGVGGGIFGAFDAANLFAVDKENVDVKMRAISALWGSLKNLSIIASVVDLANEILYSIMGISFIREVSVMLYTFLSTPEESDNLDQAMRDFEDEYNNAVSKEYQEFLMSDEGKKSLVTEKDENGNTVQRQMTLEEFKKSGKATTFQEYNNAKHKTVATKIKTAVSGVKDKIVGAASAFAGWKDRKWSELGSGYFNVDEMNEDGTMKSQLEIAKERGKKILMYPLEIVKTAIGSVMKVLEPFTKIVGGAIKGIGTSLTSGMKEMFQGGLFHIASPEYWTNPNKADDEAGAISNVGFYVGRIVTLLPGVVVGVAGSLWKVFKGAINGIKKMGAAMAEDSVTGFGSVKSIKDVFSGTYWSVPSEQDSEFSAVRKIAFYINRVVMFLPSAIVGLVHDVMGLLDPIIKPIKNAMSGLADKVDLDEDGISDLKEDKVGGMNKIIYYTSKFFTIGATVFRGILKKVNAFVAPIISSLKNAVGAIPQVLLDSVGKNPFDGDYWKYKAPDDGDGGMLHKIVFYTIKVISMPITGIVTVIKGIGKKIGGVIGGIVDTAKKIGSDIGDGIKYAQSGESMFSNNFWTLKDESGEGIGPLRKILFVVGRLGVFAVMSVINVVKKVKDNIGPIMDTVKKVGGLIAGDFKGTLTDTLDSKQGAFGNKYWTMKGDSDEGLGPMRKIIFYGTRVLAFPVMAVVTVVHNIYLAIKPVIDSVKSAISGVKDVLSDKGESKDGDIRKDKSKAPTPKNEKFSFNPLPTIAYYGKKVFTFIFNTVSTVVKVAYTVLKPIITVVGKVMGFIIEDLATMTATAATKGVISKDYWTFKSDESESGGFAILRPIIFYAARLLTLGPMLVINMVTAVMRNIKPIVETAKNLGTAIKDDFTSGFSTAIKNPLGLFTKEYWVLNDDNTEGLGVARKILFYAGRVWMFPIVSVVGTVSLVVKTVSKIIKTFINVGISIKDDAVSGLATVIDEPAGSLSKEYWTMSDDTDDNGLGPVRKILFYAGRVLMFPMMTVFTVVKNVVKGISNLIKGIIKVAGVIKTDAVNGLQTVLREPAGSFSSNYWTMSGNESDEGFGPLRKILFYAGRVLMFPHMTMVTVVKKVFEGAKALFEGIMTVAGYIKNDAETAFDTAMSVGTFSTDYWTMSDEASEEGIGPLRTILFYAGRILLFPVLTVTNVVKKVFEGAITIFNGVKTVAEAIGTDVIDAAVDMDATDIFTSDYWSPSDKVEDAGTGFNVLYKITFYTTRVLLMPVLIVKSAIDMIGKTISGFIEGIKDIGAAASKAVNIEGVTIFDYFDPSKAGLATKTGIGSVIQSVIFYGIRALLFPAKAMKLIMNTAYDAMPGWLQTGLEGIGEMINWENWADGSIQEAAGMWVEDHLGFGGNGTGRSSRVIGGNGGSGPDSQNGFAYYSQNDPSIKNSPYTLSGGGKSDRPETMGSRGCGPTAMAMVASSVKGGYGENPYSPTNMARIAEQGNYSTNVGTTPSYFTQVGQQLGMNVTPSQPNGRVLQSMLGSGEPVIMQGQSTDSSSPYTSGGHYVVAVGMNPDGTVNVNDPRGKKYSKAYTMDQMINGSGMMWGYSDAEAGYGSDTIKGKGAKARPKFGGYGTASAGLAGISTVVDTNAVSDKGTKKKKNDPAGFTYAQTRLKDKQSAIFNFVTGKKVNNATMTKPKSTPTKYEANPNKTTSDGYRREYYFNASTQALSNLVKFVKKYDLKNTNPKAYEHINSVINLSTLNTRQPKRLTNSQYNNLVGTYFVGKNSTTMSKEYLETVIDQINKSSNYNPSDRNNPNNGSYMGTQEKINSYMRSFNAYKASYYQSDPANRPAIVKKMKQIKSDLKKYENSITGETRAYIKRDQYKSLVIPKKSVLKFDNLGYATFNGKTSAARQADYSKKLNMLQNNMSILQSRFYQAHNIKERDSISKQITTTTKKILNLNKRYGMLTDGQYSEYMGKLVKLKKKFAKEKNPEKRAEIKNEIFNLSNKIQGASAGKTNGGDIKATANTLENNIAIWTTQYYTSAHDAKTRNELSDKIAEAKKQLAALYGVDESKINVTVPEKTKVKSISASDVSVSVEGNNGTMLSDGTGVSGGTGDGSWVKAIKAVKAAIAAQKPGYSQSNFIKINIDGVEYSVRTDCSGFVSACLKVVGKMNSGTNLSSQNFRNKSDSTMMATGFTPMDWPGWDGLQEGDIIAKSGHVEIFAYNDGSGHKVYNCGSDKAVNNPDATPSSKPEYDTVWRPSADISGSASGSSTISSSNANNGNGSLASKLAALANAMVTPIKEYMYGSTSSDSSSGSTSSSGSSSVASVNITGGSTPEKVWNYFTGKGYSPAATAGILGNMQQESGVDPSKIQYGNSHAAGIVQWERYDLKSGRWKNMSDFATSRGYKWTDLEPQLMFVDEELNNLSSAYWKGSSSGMSNAGATGTDFASWKQSNDVEMATRQFEGAFERAGKPMMDNRISAAKQYYNKFSGGNGGFGGFGDSPSGSSKVSKNYSTSGGKTKPSNVYGGFGGSTKPSRTYGGYGTSNPSNVYGGFGAGDVSDVANVADTSYMVNSDYINPDKVPVQTKPNNSKSTKSTNYRNSGGYGQTISNGINNYNQKQSQKSKTDKDTMVNILTEMLAELKGTNVGINKFNDKEFKVNSPVYVSDTTNNNVVTKQDGQTKKKSESIKKKTSFVDKDSYSIAKKIASGRSYA